MDRGELQKLETPYLEEMDAALPAEIYFYPTLVWSEYCELQDVFAEHGLATQRYVAPLIVIAARDKKGKRLFAGKIMQERIEQNWDARVMRRLAKGLQPILDSIADAEDDADVDDDPAVVTLKKSES